MKDEVQNKILSVLEIIQQDVGIIKQDLVVVKQDIKILQKDVDILKEDVGVLKEDVGVLKEDVGVLKHDVGTLKFEMSEVKLKLKEHDVKFEQLFNAVKENQNKLTEQDSLLNKLLAKAIDHEYKLQEHSVNFIRVFTGQDTIMEQMDGLVGAVKKNAGEIAALGMGRDRHEERMENIEKHVGMVTV